MPGIVGLITRSPRVQAEAQLRHMLRCMLHEPLYKSVTWADGANYLREMLLDSRSLSRSYLQPCALEQIVESHINGSANYTVALSKVLTLELVDRLFLDGQ